MSFMSQKFWKKFPLLSSEKFHQLTYIFMAQNFWKKFPLLSSEKFLQLTYILMAHWFPEFRCDGDVTSWALHQENSKMLIHA